MNRELLKGSQQETNTSVMIWEGSSANSVKDRLESEGTGRKDPTSRAPLPSFRPEMQKCEGGVFQKGQSYLECSERRVTAAFKLNSIFYL